jgi:hypothetical protein
MLVSKTYVISTMIYDRRTDSHSVQYLAISNYTGYPYFTKDVLCNEVRTFNKLEDAINFVNENYDKTTNTFRGYYEHTIGGNILIMELETTVDTAYTVHRDKIFG